MKAAVERCPQLMTSPRFEREATTSVKQLAQYSVEEIQQLLKCNAKIAAENKLRYLTFLEGGERLQAALAYTGMAYRHLDAATFSPQEDEYANTHLWITSFLYGLLRPMDGIYNYRLEGNVKLPENQGLSMFDYWKPLLTDVLIQSVKADGGTLMYLATEEMKRLFNWKRVMQEINIIEPQFLVDDGTRQKVVTVYAKMCRGAMARYLIQNRIESADAAQSFSYEGFNHRGAYTWLV